MCGGAAKFRCSFTGEEMAKAEKLDLRKQFKQYYTASQEPKLLVVEASPFLSIVGRGEPGGVGFTERLNALYSVVYTVKMALKKSGRDFVPLPLEALWWADDPKKILTEVPPQDWNWKLMIRQPDFVTHELVEEGKKEVQTKKNIATAEVQLEVLEEGMCVQILHIGSYASEESSIKKMLAFIEANRLEVHGLHHEIYLSDPRRTPESKLRTIIRLAVR